MTNLFQVEKLQGVLVAKCVETGAIAPDGLIRDIQIKNAYKNSEILAVDPATGRVNRLPGSIIGADSEASNKLNFLQVVTERDPAVMFTNLERLTRMVGRGVQPSLLVTGGAGLGKTYIIKKTLSDMGLVESTDFVHFKGRATAAGLFITLYENSDKILVLDDCDSVFKDDDAVNILKAALDSYDTRHISYLSAKPIKDFDGNPVPRSFEFTGKVIFISNIPQRGMDEAIKSRSFVADISMTTKQMFERIDQLMDTLEPTMSKEIKNQALTIMKDLSEKYDGVEINLRSFIKAARICAMGFENPEAMVAEQIIAM